MTKQILVVEDSESSRYAAVATLENAGYEVLEAVDGEDALNKAKTNHNIALVLTDCNMPKMNGLELTQALRKLPDYKEIPIFLLTTEFTDEKKTEGRAAGASGWMVKPFDAEKLLEVIEQKIA